jgi:hypothetical protein
VNTGRAPDALPIRTDDARTVGLGCTRGLSAAQSQLLSTKFRDMIVELGFQIPKLHSKDWMHCPLGHFIVTHVSRILTGCSFEEPFWSV